MLALNSVQRELQIPGFARVIEARGAIGFVAATAKNEQICSPSTSCRLAKESGDIVRTDGSFESMKKKESRCPDGRVEAMDIHEIPVGGFPSLDAGRKRRARSKKLSPERLCVAPGYPPRGAVDILASTIG